ncbi:PREDICTED: IST1-like protein [Theobroma cacao]|uniref:IST1-like protein n=1 Tax=Theobroma cacao TaxID=3641 RepID=A0AB32VHE6_THECC|nr:PREDICTED: IST1-like protein [Theobroma cacao]
MTVASAATAHSKKLMKLTLSLFRNGFNSSKCKTAAKMAVARIKLLRNKRQVVVKQMRRDIALLLQSGQDATARIRVEHVIREQNVLAANEFIELFCELVVARLSIIAKRRECPADLKEGIASLIFAAPRCAEIPELVAIRDIFQKKYGKDFVSAATDLRPNCGVNRLLIDKLSVKTPTGEVKLKVMKEIAKEHNIEWDTTESEKELLKPPEELIEGPRTFVSATSLPVKPATNHSLETKQLMTRGEGSMHFKDTVSAAEAAEESAKKAIAAAQAAAYLANRDSNLFNEASGHVKRLNDSSIITGFGNLSANSAGGFLPTYPPVNSQHMDPPVPGRTYESRSFERSNYYPGSEEARPNNVEVGKTFRRHSNNSPSAHSDIKFDESDCDEEIETEDASGSIKRPPERSPPPVPSSYDKQDSIHRVHPKLPDYDDLAARFEALKYRKSLP